MSLFKSKNLQEATKTGRRTKLFAVYDVKMQEYLQPFFHATTRTAMRAWEMSVNHPDSGFNKYSEDYTLFELGEFDSFTGTLYPYSAPQSLGNALQFKTPEIHEVSPAQPREINATLPN